MEMFVVFLILVVLIIVGLFVAAPFIESRHPQAKKADENSSLMAERERTLTLLQELDLDYSLGKVPAEDYSAQRAGLLQKGAEILRRLDELQGKHSGPEKEIPTPQAESSIPLVRIILDEDLEDLIAKRRAERKDKAAGFCPECGKPVLNSDRFCPSCGVAMR